jgi:hypothetical protein
MNLLKFLGNLSLFKVTNWDSGTSGWFLPNFESKEVREPAVGMDANVVSSLRTDGWGPGRHALLLDLDVPACLVPSSTEGHSHLYIDVHIPEEKYFELLDLLASCGVIETGYAVMSKAKGGSNLRLPWVKKEAA